VEFLGQARIGLVGQLRRTFEEAVSAGELRVVTVEAPAGWGKTRVAQELYGQVAMRQPRPAYWPRALDVTLSGCRLSLFRRRRCTSGSGRAAAAWPPLS
jgi:hypothetical protein